MLRLFIYLSVFLFISFEINANEMKSPFSHKTNKHSVGTGDIGATKNLGVNLILFYSKILSPIEGPRSPSYPTSTAYGIEAIQHYGFFMGTILTADRLLHESDIHNGSFIIKYNRKRYNDPLESNVFWWDNNNY